jgi:hypothetical protein
MYLARPAPLVGLSVLPAARFIDPNKTLQHCIMCAELLHLLTADSPSCTSIWFGVIKQLLSFGVAGVTSRTGSATEPQLQTEVARDVTLQHPLIKCSSKLLTCSSHYLISATPSRVA